MIWLAWRQFRAPALSTAAALALLAVILAVTGPGMADEWSSGLAACASSPTGCGSFTHTFFNDHQAVYLVLSGIVVVLPAVIGLFWGAPLIARELEAGTHRLAWHQSVTRARWLAVKLLLVGAAAALAAAIASVAVGWWAVPVDASAIRTLPRMAPPMFDARGIVPVAHAVFAFVLGVTVGMLMRRAVTAMAATLAVFALLGFAVPTLVRPHLLPSTTSTITITPDTLSGMSATGPDSPLKLEVQLPQEGAWILANGTIDSSGREVKTVPLTPSSGPCAAPPRDGKPPSECLDAIAALGYRQRIVFLPADRFWPMQWIETALYAALSAGLAGFAFWWLRRRVS